MHKNVCDTSKGPDKYYNQKLSLKLIFIKKFICIIILLLKIRTILLFIAVTFRTVKTYDMAISRGEFCYSTTYSPSEATLQLLLIKEK